MTVTDELLAELELCERRDCGLVIDRVDVCTILNELRRLRAENAGLERQNGLLTTAVSDVWKLKEGKIKSACLSQAGDATNWQAEEISRLNVENAELAKDAGRYRFVRRLDNDCFMLNALQRVSGNELDAEIDTAMATK